MTDQERAELATRIEAELYNLPAIERELLLPVPPPLRPLAAPCLHDVVKFRYGVPRCQWCGKRTTWLGLMT